MSRLGFPPPHPGFSVCKFSIIKSHHLLVYKVRWDPVFVELSPRAQGGLGALWLPSLLTRILGLFALFIENRQEASLVNVHSHHQGKRKLFENHYHLTRSRVETSRMSTRRGLRNKGWNAFTFVASNNKTIYDKHSVLKSKDITLPTKVHLVKAMDFPVVTYGRWELDYKEGWAPKNWCFQTVVLEKTFWESLGLQGEPTSPS